MPKFEIAIYNQRVRELIKAGECHRHLGDDWADTHYIEVNAPDAEVAERKVRARHAEHEGFVIVSIEQAD